jgi:tape measure domain-containing protein
VAETLTWRFEAKDLMSGPLGRAEDSVESLNRKLSQGAGSVRGLDTSSQRLGGTLGQVAGVLGQVGSLAAGITAAAAGMAVAFAAVSANIIRSVADMVRFRESAVTTLGVLMGGQGRAGISAIGGAAFRQTQAIARIAPGRASDIMAARQQAITAGFRGAEEQRVLAAGLDVGALQSGDATAQGRFVRALGQIRGRGALQAEELNQISEVGISRAEILRAVARQRGIGGTEAEQTAQVSSLMQRGQITGTEGVNAVLSAVQATTRSQLGGFAVAQGAGLAGSISNAEEALQNLITGISGLEQLPGVQAFARSIAAIGDAFGGASAAGLQLQTVVAGLINRAGAAIGGILTPERIEGFVGTLATVLPPLIDTIARVGGAFIQGLGQGLGPLIRDLQGISQADLNRWSEWAITFGRNLGVVVGFAAQLTAAFATLGVLLTNVAGFAIQAYNAWQGIGTSIVDGIVAGIRGAAGRVTEAVQGMASGAVNSAREFLGIRSPSRVFAELGDQTAAGFAVGVERGTGDAQGAVQSLVAPPALGAGGAGAGAPLAGRAGVFQIFVDGAGREAAAIVDEIEQRVGVTFDRLALSGGSV